MFYIFYENSNYHNNTSYTIDVFLGLNNYWYTYYINLENNLDPVVQ